MGERHHYAQQDPHPWENEAHYAQQDPQPWENEGHYAQQDPLNHGGIPGCVTGV